MASSIEEPIVVHVNIGRFNNAMFANLGGLNSHLEMFLAHSPLMGVAQEWVPDSAAVLWTQQRNLPNQAGVMLASGKFFSWQSAGWGKA